MKKQTLGTNLSASISSLPKLRKRFLASGFDGFDDEEIIELVMGLWFPPDEAKRIAQAALEKFQNLIRFISASSAELKQIGFSANCIFFVQLLNQLPSEILRQKIIARPVFTSAQEVFEYLFYSMRDLKIEVFKVIYLDSQHHIIDVVDVSTGTAASASVRPRVIIQAANQNNASALIFAHNHPSGNSAPSRPDKRLTRDLVFMGMFMQTKVLDHIIIGGEGYFSFAVEKLIEKYEDEFMNLRIRMNLAAEA